MAGMRCVPLMVGGLAPVLVLPPTAGAYASAGGGDRTELGVLLMEAGWGLVAFLSAEVLAGLPTPAGWGVRLTAAGAGIRLTRPDGQPFYDGALGVAPVGWLGHLLAGGRLLAILASELALPARAQVLGPLAAAAGDGRVVGAALPLHHRRTAPPTPSRHD